MQSIFRQACGMSPITTALVLLLWGIAITDARADLYWDVNGAAAGGSGNLGSKGIWGSDNFWSTSPAGDVATIGWLDGQKAIFSAGSDVTTASATLDGVQFVSGLS